MRRKLLPVTIILVALSLQGWAFFEGRPVPSPSGPNPRHLRTKPVAKDGEVFCSDDGDLTIATAKVGLSSENIRSKGIGASRGGRSSLQTKTVYLADLDADGVKEIIVYSVDRDAREIEADARWVDIYFKRSRGNYQRVGFRSYHGEIGDFMDVNGDGRYEVTILSIAEEQQGTYWAYHLYELVDGRLQPCDGQYEGFPIYTEFIKEAKDDVAVNINRQERAAHARVIAEGFQYQTIKTR